MRSIALLFAAACLAGTPSASAQDAEGEAAAFFRLRSEGVAAAQAGDLETARRRLDEADARNPGHPGLTLMRARLALGAGREDEAVALVERYAGFGLVFDPATGALAPLAGTPALASAESRLALNRVPAGAERLTRLFEIPGPGLTEAVTRDAARGRWLVSQVAGRTILAVDDAGRATPFLSTAPEIGGVLGLALDASRGAVWAATAPLPPAVHAAAGRPLPRATLVRVDLESGRIEARFEAPAGDGDRAFGDVALGPDGAVYVSDSAAGEVLVARAGGGSLDILLGPGVVASPQGLAVSPDGSTLIVADYASGLWRVETATGAARRIPTPEHASLIGVDGLALDGERLYAIQNGVAPQRVLRLDLNADWTRIDGIDVAAANLPEIDEPTTGIVLDGELIFVARSQWSDFDAEGAPRDPDMGPARIVRLQLD